MTNPTVSHLALSARWLAYAETASASAEDFPDRVVAVDLHTSASKVIARSAWPHGQTDWVVADGDWVFWTDQNIAGADSPKGLRWSIRGIDLRNHHRVTVARSSFDSPVPLPVAGGGRLAWAQQRTPRSAASVIKEFTAADRSVRTRATLPADRIPDQLAIGRDHVYYDASSTDGRRSDVWSVDTDRSGAPHRITKSGKARAVSADPTSASVAWSNAAGTADPSSFTLSSGGRDSTVVRSGTEYDLHAGNSFATWVSGDGALVARDATSATSRRVASGLVVPCRTAIAGRRVAYCTRGSRSGTISINVSPIPG